MTGYQIVSESLKSKIVKVYHFTELKNIDSIKKNGLDPLYLKLHKKQGLFSIPKWFLHTKIPAIYVSPDLNIDFDNINNPHYKSKPLIITIETMIIDLFLDEDIIKDLFWIPILKNYFGYNKNRFWWNDIDKQLFQIILKTFLEKNYDLSKFNKINQFSYFNPNQKQKIQILDCVIANYISIRQHYTKKNYIKHNELKSCYIPGMMLLIDNSNQWVQKNFKINEEATYLIRKKILFDNYPKIVSMKEK